MIAVVFLLVVLVTALVLTLSGSQIDLPAGQLAILAVLFMVFFLAGIYVAAAMGLLSLVASLTLTDRPLYNFFGEVGWESSANYVFLAVPLFILMGEILLRSGLSHRLYKALNVWVGGLPGGLLHTNIGTCAIFATVCGSSAATAAMIGSVALPYFRKTNYNERMVLGSLAGGGALGQLIPPSISLIVYGLFTGTSIGQLYSVAFVAGILVTFFMMAYIFFYSLVTRTKGVTAPFSASERLSSLRDLLPTAILIVVVLGSLYLGLATASEAAALGVLGALLIAWIDGHLSLSMVNTALRNTVRTSSMLGLILVAAFILNYILGALGLPKVLAAAVTTLPVPPVVITLCIFVFYIALGAFMEGFSLILTTVPVIFPVIVALGYNPVWYGVAMTMLIEVALISPPDGVILYILQGLRRPRGSIGDVFVGVLPFTAIYLGATLLMLFEPNSILWILNFTTAK